MAGLMKATMMGAAKTFDFAGLFDFVNSWFRAVRPEQEDPADVSSALPFVSDDVPPAERRKLERLDANCRVCASSAPPGA
jgi:hypothetical protein